MSVPYPNIDELSTYKEFREIYSNNRLIEENVHMKRYQILPIRYMSPENDTIDRFLIYHSPGTGKSFTALWITLNYINVYNKPTIILVKSIESIMEFKQRIASWYNYTFKFYHPPQNVNNYKQFISKYIEFHTYITFCKSLDDEKPNSNYDDRLIIIDEIHHFRNTTGKNKFIYNKLLIFLNAIQNSKVIFMSATPIFDNYNEITSLVKLIKPNLQLNHPLTPENLEMLMKGHVSYYGLNPLDTIVNIRGESIPSIHRYKIFKIPMNDFQLQYYHEMSKNKTKICNIGVNYVKATLGILNFSEVKANKNSDQPFRYILDDNDSIVHSHPSIYNQIIEHAKDLKKYCCKLYYFLDIINSSKSPDGPVFVYCNIIDDVGIYYFASLLCHMGYNYVYDYNSSLKYGNKDQSNSADDYPELKKMRDVRSDNRWNFTFITGDKRLCPNMMDRLDIFNNDSNKNGGTIKVLFGSDILSESVDIMNVRQLHILTPHWNYEKINQIIGRIRRVGSHDALPVDQRSVDVYLYMAYNSKVKCSNNYCKNF